MVCAAYLVLPDLTLPENVVLCRQWVKPAPAKTTKNAKGGDPSFLGRCVFLSFSRPPRISSFKIIDEL